MVEQKPTNVLEIFNSSILKIPQYQRNYSWRKKHVEDLLNDIDYLFNQDKIDRNDDDHYFGTIVLHQTDKVTAGSDEFDEFDIVDGQQRLTTISITMGAISEAIDSLEIELTDLDPSEDRPEKQSKTLRDIYVESEPHRRLDLQNDDSLMYKRLVVDKTAPKDVSSATVSEERLADAKSTIDNWLGTKRSNSNSDLEYYRDLLTLIRLINNRFEVTRYKVGSISEAGRIFETLNDRGRTLTIADKIKSYLVYCANRIGDNQLADDVFNQFGKVIRNITTVGTESDLTQFIEEHWRMFSGEIQYGHNDKYDINDLHRRIKAVDDHIPLQRDNGEIREYIDRYLESLLQASESYQQVMNPSRMETKGDETAKAIQTNLENIHRNISKQNIVGLLIALHQEFGFSEEFEQVTVLLDSFGWRAYQVCRASTDFRRRKFKELSHKIYYTNNVTGASDIFGDRTKDDFDVFSSKGDAFASVCREIENAIGNYGPNRSFEKNLRRSDVFEGNINQDGWNGLRNQRLIKYFLYEYELSHEGSSLPDFNSFVNETSGIEYLLPTDKSNVSHSHDVDHAHYVGKFGNLAILHPTDDKTDPADSYEERYESVYAKSPMNILNRLPEPDEATWGADQIEQRTDRMVSFALERWEVNTGVYVPLLDFDDDLSEQDVMSTIYPQIEDEFNNLDDVVPDELNNVPKIVRDTDFDFDKADYTQTCPSCGATEFRASADNGSIEFYCSCEEQLDQPLFALYLEPFNIETTD
ncbi:hypothetical protein C475_19643 [Halosimplex carlsbadense 2-9-1]|uniref:DUF262 domain-containing protein n=1 Tax=Halosimplex carlsbadense 2-9-1 TaxID=797114 RepID=M0CC31_9EURY|nr:DUF262 domain-containing protein [Halosimplex carlsbadense]ELZ20846.1 hypothetical protein C475_19643 [Halosimplex carlsbadense 2-9-1]